MIKFPGTTKESKWERACRMAYTLDQEQPVKCTIISDQPLFYMDFEEALLEDESDGSEFASFGDETMDFLEKCVSDFEENYEERRSAKAESYTKAFKAIAEEMTAADKKDTAVPASMDELKETISKSRMGKELLQGAESADIEFLLCDKIEDSLYDRDAQRIVINQNLEQPEQILFLARELRRFWQHRNGALIHPLTFHPDQAILIHRSQLADLSVAMVRIAWELNIAHEQDSWNRLEHSSMEDIARSFARECHMDFRSLNNGTASSAAFETWFLSERCNHEDRKIIQQMLSDYNGYIFDNEQSSRNVSADLIAALGSQPFGKNYLAQHVQTIMGDPIFTEVRDRSNANFLWFIKFEKCFKEAEQELQNVDDITGHEILHGLYQNKKEWSENNEKADNVVTLQPCATQGAMDKKLKQGKKQAGSGSAEIINFRYRAEDS